MNLSIIIPILNERKNISLLVSKIALNLKNKKSCKNKVINELTNLKNMIINN